MKRLIVIFGVLVLFLGYLTVSFKLPLAKSTVSTAPTITPSPTQLNSDTLWSLVQNWRTSQGLQPYIKDQNLCSYASQRTIQIKSDFSHSGFNIKSVCGDSACRAGENLSEDYYSEQDTLNAWLASPDHLANLKDNFTNSCIECSGLYCVQEFVSYTSSTTPIPQQTSSDIQYKIIQLQIVKNCINNSPSSLYKEAVIGCYEAVGLTPPIN